MDEHFGTGLGLEITIDELMNVMMNGKIQVVSDLIETITLGTSPAKIRIGKEASDGHN